jgi:hypothetical protein
MWKNTVVPVRAHLAVNGADKMSFSCRMTKATLDTHSYVQYLVLLHGNSDYANEPEGYVLRSLPALFLFSDICYHTCSYGYTLTRQQPSDLAVVVQGGAVSL